MRRFASRNVARSTAILASVLALGVISPAADASAATVSFESRFGWSTFTAADDGSASSFVGGAQEVCLNSNRPGPRCAEGAYSWAYPFPGWFAGLSPIPEASWIWAPHVDIATRPADLQGYIFSRTFQLSGVPTTGWIAIAADDFAEVRVNGTAVGTIGSVTDIAQAGAAQSSLTLFDISAYLVSGRNSITVLAQNGPSDFAGCPSPCSYGENVAGVVFGGELGYQAP